MSQFFKIKLKITVDFISDRFKIKEILNFKVGFINENFK